MTPILQVSSDSFNFGSSASSLNINNLMTVLLYGVVFFFLVVILYFSCRMIRRLLNRTNEWKQLQIILRRSSLTREEAFLIKQTLKENHVKHPVKVMTDIKQYKRWVEEPLKEVGAHKQHLITSIREKIFGSKTFHQEML